MTWSAPWLLLVLLASPAAAVDGTPPGEELRRLAGLMSGSFSSAAQAAADPDFRDIRLSMTPIWTTRGDAVWLYVEQAVAGSEAAPYRQRVYRLTQLDGDLFESRVYALPAPERVVGAWRQSEPLADLAPADLVERDGCAILMRRRGETYAGSTLGRLCASELRGAAYATAEVVLTAAEMRTWDRGFDDHGQQVWGAEKGPYVFVRVAAGAPAATPAS